MKRMNQNAGFSLIELLVVIAIMAVLAGVGVAGYSIYTEEANKGVDRNLAAEIERALMLAASEGKLESGSSVTVFFDKTQDVAVSGNAGDAMLKAFGDDYASLRLSWDGWATDLGIVNDSELINHVNGSSFSKGNLGLMLEQVQTVVDEYSGYMVGGTASPEIVEYLKKAGVAIADDGTVTEDNATAVGNAALFWVADHINDVVVDQDSFYDDCWRIREFSSLNFDPVAEEGAKYAVTLALATYIDAECGTTYCSQLTGTGTELLTKSNSVYNEISSSSDASVQAALMEYYGITGVDANGPIMSDNPPAKSDALAFYAYMKGITNSSDSMLQTGNLSSTEYFDNEEILNYVENYIDIGTVMNDLKTGGSDISKGAFVFYYDGIKVSCAPLDY